MKKMASEIKQRVKIEKDKALLDIFNEQTFGVHDFYKVSYNEYLKDKRNFNKKYFEAYMKYYYRKDYSFQYNLDNEHFELINLSKETRKKKTKILNHTTINKE